MWEVDCSGYSITVDACDRTLMWLKYIRYSSFTAKGENIYKIIKSNGSYMANIYELAKCPGLNVIFNTPILLAEP